MPRDLRVDTIRGLLLVIMTLNHTHNALQVQGWLQTLTVSPWGFVTGAEGFIFVSGFVVGLVYFRYSRNPRRLIAKSFARGRTIYLHHLVPLYGLYLLALAVPFLAVPWARELSFYYLAKRTLLAEALLLYQPEIFDILPMYVLFVLATPFLILLLKRRWGWGIVLALSLALWALGQQFDPLCWLNERYFPGHRCGWFNILVWQVPFLLGLILGVAKPRLSQVRFFRCAPFVIGVAALTLALFGLRHGLLPSPDWLAASVTQKNLAWLRIVNLLALASFVGVMFTRLPLRARLPGLDFLGQHSLQVFTFQVLLVYSITPFREPIAANLVGWGYPLFMGLIAASLLLPAYLHKKLRAAAPSPPVENYDDRKR